MRRVLQVSPALFGSAGIFGGGERAAYGLARAVAREIPTTLVSFGPERISRRDGDLSVEIYPSTGDFGGQLFDPLSYRFLAQVRKADVVHCHQYRVAVSQLAIIAGAALGKRTFVTDRGGVGVHFDPELPVERCLTALLPLSRFSLANLPEGVPSRVVHGGATELFLSAHGLPERPPARTPVASSTWGGSCATRVSTCSSRACPRVLVSMSRPCLRREVSRLTAAARHR